MAQSLEDSLRIIDKNFVKSISQAVLTHLFLDHQDPGQGLTDIKADNVLGRRNQSALQNSLL